MKVVHIIVGLGGGGAEGALYRLCANSPSTTRMTVVSLTDGGIHGVRLREVGVEVISLGIRSAASIPAALWRLRRILRSRRPDVVQTWMYHADLLGGLAAIGLGIPVCWGIRSSGVTFVNNFRTQLVARLCAILSRIVPAHAVSCSEYAVQQHREFGYRVPMTVVANGYEYEKWAASTSTTRQRSDFNLNMHEIVVAHAARAHPQKDHHSLALAFSQAYACDPRLRLLLCGTGLEAGSPDFETLPFSEEARTAVRALGNRDDLPELWGLADFFVLSSVSEGFPNVVAEAMASSLPAVVTDVGDAAMIVGDTGKVVPSSNPTALAVAILKMAALSHEERTQLGKAAFKRVKGNFSVERMVVGFHAVWIAITQKAGT